MRTTLTIDDDLGGILHRRSQELDKSFKEVVNETLRAGLAASGGDFGARAPFKVIPRALRLRAGYDPDKMNQLVDELGVEDYLRKAAEDDSAGR